MDFKLLTTLRPPPEMFAFIVLSHATPMSMETNGVVAFHPDDGIWSLDKA